MATINNISDLTEESRARLINEAEKNFREHDDFDRTHVVVNAGAEETNLMEEMLLPGSTFMKGFLTALSLYDLDPEVAKDFHRDLREGVEIPEKEGSDYDLARKLLVASQALTIAKERVAAENASR